MSDARRFIAFDRTPPRARLTLRRPPLNVMDLAMLAEMTEALEELAADSAVHVLVLGAEGERAFSSGVEVRDHFPDKAASMIASFHRVCRRLDELPQVTIAAVHASALGGGMELVSCCDFVLAAETASFGQPEIDLGCFPPLGAALYPRRAGALRAAEIVLLGNPLTARAACEAGLVTRVMPPERLDETVDELAASLLAKSPAVLRLAKKALRTGRADALTALPAIERIYLDELVGTEDMREGLGAFLEKRPPSWKGK